MIRYKIYLIGVLLISLTALVLHLANSGSTQTPGGDRQVSRVSVVDPRDRPASSSNTLTPAHPLSSAPEPLIAAKQYPARQKTAENKPEFGKADGQTNDSATTQNTFSDVVLMDIIQPELERRRMAFKAIQDDFQLEDRIDQWASPRETELIDLVYSNHYLVDLSPVSVECKTATCMISFSGDDMDSKSLRETSHNVFKQMFNVDKTKHKGIQAMSGHIEANLKQSGFKLYLYEKHEQ